MNFESYIKATRSTYGDDPTENTEEAVLCTLCAADLTPEEIELNEEDNKYCNNCFYSCCGDELDQELRMCPTCKEHN
tara:strand:+ start:1194 stop:1424 length:231 start_codon:yes stop_codon:yes gene_type:complete